jgi:hypothetical protein
VLLVRVMRWLRGAYGPALLVGYCIAFLLAFACVFFFPLGALALVILSVLSTALVPIGGGALAWADRFACRRMIGRGTCPWCGAGISRAQGAEPGPACSACGAEWQRNGERMVPVAAAE